MNLKLKTALMLPWILLVGTVMYIVVICLLLIAYFVGVLMLPTKLHGYLKELADYRRIQG